jgi:hypothetical protein
MRPILLFLLFFVAIKANSQNYTIIQPSTDIVIKPQLGIPFGTIAKLEVQFFDGDDLHLKAYTGTHLLKINSVNGKTVKDTVLLEYTDETKSLAPKNEGHKLTIMAYESGSFTGIPDNYFKYQPVRQDQGFGFRHNLIVVSNLTNKADR